MSRPRNSRPTGRSPIPMPPPRSASVSLPRRTGIVGTDTRQRPRLDWTPLSLHSLDESHTGLPSSLPLPRTRHILAARLGVHMPAAVLNGTARGIECVSRTWGSRQPSHPHTTKFGGRGGRASIGVWCRAPLSPRHGNEARERRVAATPVPMCDRVLPTDGQRTCPQLTPGSLIGVGRRRSLSTQTRLAVLALSAATYPARSAQRRQRLLR